jgi:hypothetical protein
LTVQVTGATGGNFFLNVLIDLNMDGKWGGVAGGGEAEWVTQNFPVSVSPSGAMVSPPPFAFANGNRLPDGAWMRIALTKEMVTATNWDGSGSFSSGEIEDHVISLPLEGGKRTPMLVVTNDGPYPVPGATGMVFATVTVTNLGAAGNFNWTLNPLTGDVDVAPVAGGPMAIAAAGHPAGGDVVTIVVTATGGTKDSSWLFRATIADPDAVVVAGGIVLGHSGESTTTLVFIPKIWAVFVWAIESFFQHFAGYSTVGINLYIFGNDPEPVPGATVTVQMTRPDGTTEIKEVTTDENGHATIDFTIFVFGTYTITVLDITGENMEYTPENNVESSVTVEVN